MGRTSAWSQRTTSRKVGGTAAAGLIGLIVGGAAGSAIASIAFVVASKLIKRLSSKNRRLQSLVKELREMFRYDPSFNSMKDLEAAATGLGIELTPGSQRRVIIEQLIAEVVKYADGLMDRNKMTTHKFREVYHPSIAGNKICEMILRKTSMYYLITGISGEDYENSKAEYEARAQATQNQRINGRTGVNRVARRLTTNGSIFGRLIRREIRKYNEQTALDFDKATKGELTEALFHLLGDGAGNISTAKVEKIYLALFDRLPKTNHRGGFIKGDKVFNEILEKLGPDLMHLSRFEEQMQSEPDRIRPRDIRWFKEFDNLLGGSLSHSNIYLTKTGTTEVETDEYVKDEKGNKTDKKVKVSKVTSLNRDLSKANKLAAMIKEQQDATEGDGANNGFAQEAADRERNTKFRALGMLRMPTEKGKYLSPDYVMPVWIVDSNIANPGGAGEFDNVLYPKKEFVSDNKLIKYSGKDVDNNLYTIIAAQTRLLSNIFHLQYGKEYEDFDLLKDSEIRVYHNARVVAGFTSGVINKPAEPVYVVNSGLPVETDVYDLIQLILQVIPGGALLVGGQSVIDSIRNAPDYTKMLSSMQGRGAYERGGVISNTNNFTRFISGDSYVNKSNPEQVSIDWGSQQVKINPIPTLDQIKSMPHSQPGSSPLTMAQREAPMAVGIVSGLVQYDKKLKGTTTQDNQALKVYAVNNMFDESILVGNVEMTPMEVMVDMTKLMGNVIELVVQSNATQNTISGAAQAIVSGLDKIKNKIGENGRGSANGGIDISSVLRGE
jgi:hypothetical protein